MELSADWLLGCFHIAPDSDSGFTMSQYDLTDFEWRVIEPLLTNKPRGVPLNHLSQRTIVLADSASTASPTSLSASSPS
ncbi:hypothetical protein J2T08_003301 [Neorhizobium galegae]|uniref:transposase n=1 Tax=Neorhizobium galegae TaxID=399 RepID=UPI002783C6B7|nr:transposase [Neorhizobium galegae]MDQ0135380.1 hypothetical protein [Neorhizobium galegae]